MNTAFARPAAPAPALRGAGAARRLLRLVACAWLACLGGLAGSLPAQAAAGAAAADEGVVLLDSARSHAEFSVKVLWMFDVEGSFGHVNGHVRIDSAAGTGIVDARIDVNAVRMRRSGTEEWVKSEEFFDVARHPEIRFLSDPFPLARLAEGGELPGSLGLRGIRSRVVFVLRPAGCARPGIECAVEASGTLRRAAFGMRSRKGTLADKVELHLSVWLDEAVAARAP